MLPNSPITVIIDYDAGNLRNVQKAIEFLGYQSLISNRIEEIGRAEILILPGVGQFYHGMKALEALSLCGVLERKVVQEKTPLLGICLGMQLLAKEGTEGGRHLGLGFINGTVQKLDSNQKGLRLPHIGWNDVVAKKASILFSGIPEHPDFYFVHSYQLVCEEAVVSATCEYGRPFPAAIEKDNIFATQFHPEKSQRYGLQILKNFLTCSENVIRTKDRTLCLK